MEKFKVFIFLVVLFSSELLTQGVHTQWVFPQPSGNNYVTVEYIDNSTGYILLTRNSFYKVTSSIFNLEPKLALKGYYKTSTLSKDGFEIISCDSGSIYTTTNAGDSWNIFDLPEPLICNALSRGPNNRIYAGTNDGTIYISEDNGISFSLLSALPKKELSSICISSHGTLIAGFNGANRGIYRSTNNGQSWAFVNNAVHVTDLKSFEFSDTIYSFFVSDTNSTTIRMMKSTDDGLTWILSNHPGHHAGKYYFLNSKCLIVTAAGMIEYSTDSGSNWIRLLNNHSEGLSWLSGCFKDTLSGIIVGKGGFIIESITSLRNWQKLSNSRPFNGIIKGLIKTPEIPAKFKVITSETTSVTSDEGASWYSDALIANWKFYRQNDGVYIGLNSVIYANPFGRSAAKVSTNGGITFTTVYGDTSEMILGFARFNSERSILHRSPYYPTSFLDRWTTDGGLTWPFENSISYNDNIFRTGDKSAITSNALTAINFLTDYGKTKNSIYPQFPSAAGVNSLAAPSDSVAFLAANKGYIVKLDTKKRTLISSVNPLPFNFNYIDFRKNYGLVVADRGFLLYTTDTGDSWKVLRAVTDNKLIQVHFDNDSTAFAVDEFGGIIKIGFSYTTDIKDQVEAEIPQQYTLEQNYPNPFNNSTVIKYSTPVAGTVRLMVFDITGKIVATPVNTLHQPGVYQLNLDAGSLSSGIYFYQLDSGIKRITKKLILLK